MNRDRLAIGLSLGCIVHCLAAPLLLISLPALHTWHQRTETQVHWLLLLVAIPVSLVALLRGCRAHRRFVVAWLGGCGLAVLLLAASGVMGEGVEAPLTVAGAGVLGAAHVFNLRLR